MKDSVILSTIDQAFTPKDRTDEWRVHFGANISSGYDFSLVIQNPETGISYEIEVGIMEDGRLCGQITPDQNGKGPDALVIFDTTSEIAHVSGNWGGAKLIINANGRTSSTVVEDSTGRRGFY
jgi:hypothetical protein